MDSAHNCCNINEARHRMERGQHFLWPSDPVSVDWKDYLGAEVGPTPFRNGVQPGTWLLLIQTRYAVQPAVVRVVQHKIRHRRRNWSDPTTQGSSGICGTGAATQTFSALMESEQLVVHEDVEERYFSYALLRQSGIQHVNLKVDFQNDFTTRDNWYPKKYQHTLYLLENTSRQLCKERRSPKE